MKWNIIIVVLGVAALAFESTPLSFSQTKDKTGKKAEQHSKAGPSSKAEEETNTHAQQVSNQSVKQYESGKIITLKDGTELQVLSGDKDVFAKCEPYICDVKGVPVVVTLKFSGNTMSAISLHLSPEAERSDVTLIVGERKIIPTAMGMPDSREPSGYVYFNHMTVVPGFLLCILAQQGRSKIGL